LKVKLELAVPLIATSQNLVVLQLIPN